MVNLTNVDTAVAVLGLAAIIIGMIWWVVRDYEDDDPDAPC